MKLRELREKSTAELAKMYRELGVKRQELNFKVGSGQLKNVREIRDARKTLARILTILGEREETV